MERWGARHQNAPARRVARELYRCGERGVDPVSGLVFDALLDDFSVLRSTSRLWPQTERVRAAALIRPTPSSVFVTLLPALRAIEACLDTPTPGLWRDSLRPQVSEDTCSASSLYHIQGAIVALDGVRASIGAAEAVR
jgi:mannose-1-phosphate guanylyltransferase/mannose-6-phosphate isomerase